MAATAVAVIEGAGELMASAREYVRHSKAPATLKAYESDCREFVAWCESRGLAAMPAQPETVALYIAALADAGRKVSTIGRRLAAISKAHQAAGYDSPASLKHAAVSEVWKGVRRVKGVAPEQKSPLLTADLKALLSALPDTLIGVRDRALLLLGFSAALRRSELVALDVTHVAITRDGLIVTLVRSKVDQEGEGRKIGVPYSADPASCPVRALQAWLEAAVITEGALFRQLDRHGNVGGRLSAQSVALIVKRRAMEAGIDPGKLSGHSLRAGHATSAAMNGASERSIMRQTGHKSAAMVRRYIRVADIWRENSATKLGL
jgi:site-specific recombinase XerD